MTDPRTHLARRPFHHVLRVAPWHGRPDAAVVAPVPSTRATTDEVRTALTHLTASGVTEIFTAALAPDEQVPFTQAGFAHHEHLHLLRHALADTPAGGSARLRRGWRGDYPAVLALDALAFDEFWRFDRRALAEARAATPTGRFRVAQHDGDLAGYAVVGAGVAVVDHDDRRPAGQARRRRRTAYLQRLAVHPDHQGHGVGTALIADALAWARRRGATELLVNTQERNVGALRLYCRLGFAQQPFGLDVLRWTA